MVWVRNVFLNYENGGETSFLFMGWGRNVFPKYELGAKRLTKNGANWLWGEKSVYRVEGHCWFNAGQLCTTLAQHHSNTDRTPDSSTPPSTAITERLTNVASMLSQRVRRWPNNNPAFCIHRLLCGNCYRGDNLFPLARKATTQIQSPNCEIMLGHRLRRWASIMPTETL